MAGHTGDGVIKDDNRGITLVIRDIGKTSHTGMHESGITDNRNRLSFAFLAERLIKTMNGADGSTHTQGHLHGGQWRNGTQSVASDIAKNRTFILG